MVLKSFVVAALVAMPILTACAVDSSPDSSVARDDDEATAATDSALELATWDSCSTSQKRKLRNAERLAKYISRQDIVEKVVSFKNGTAPHWLIDRFFSGDGKYDATTAAFVRGRMKRLHDRIAEGDVVVRCRDIFCDDTNARVVPIFQDKITFCPGYFAKTPAYRSAVWMHELSHEIFHTTDAVYGSPTAALHDAKARQNSYPEVAAFVKSGKSGAAEQWEAFTINLIGEHFDDVCQKKTGRAITAAELAAAIEDVHASREPVVCAP